MTFSLKTSNPQVLQPENVEVSQIFRSIIFKEAPRTIEKPHFWETERCDRVLEFTKRYTVLSPPKASPILFGHFWNRLQEIEITL
jgi:hypothetical protein